jgi:hypothetical protein
MIAFSVASPAIIPWARNTFCSELQAINNKIGMNKK